MEVGIHKDRYGKIDPFCLKYEVILSYNSIKSSWIDINDNTFWNDIKRIKIFIYRWIQWDDHHQIAKDIMPIIENNFDIKCFPDLATSWHYDDKVKQFFLLSAFKYPFIKCWIFYDRRKALEWVEKTSYPKVFKLKGGASSQNVLLVNDKNVAKRIIDKMFGEGINPNNLYISGSTKQKDFKLINFIKHQGANLLRKYRGEDAEPYWQINKNYILFQEFLPNNKFDTRITVIGNRAFGFRRFVRKNDFRASGSGLIDNNPKLIDLRCVELALKISKEMKFQSMAYDFLYDENNNPMICEISYTYVDKAVYNCPGYWDDSLNFHEGHYWPQYLHLVDLLGDESLRQPQFIDVD
ncbi:hypothetical protein ACFSRY_10715 [Pontibacter locisalis]|uniref:ATP-grasp fold RimK-type domain-containing protein n=1 Tax=Pontibacter locisalis TaxID=1719035 RepID=A0ABW5INJ9_9BACT